MRPDTHSTFSTPHYEVQQEEDGHHSAVDTEDGKIFDPFVRKEAMLSCEKQVYSILEGHVGSDVQEGLNVPVCY